MTAIEKADQLREEAIQLLLAERDQIDDRLHQLGYDQEKTAPKRGRPRKLDNLRGQPTIKETPNAQDLRGVSESDPRTP